MRKIIKINNDKKLKIFKRNTYGNNFVVTVSVIGSGTDNGMVFNFAEHNFDKALKWAEEYKSEWLKSGAWPEMTSKLCELAKGAFL